MKVPRQREGAERRLGLVQAPGGRDGEAERAGSRLRGCSRGPLGHDLQRPAGMDVDARVGGASVDGSGGAGAATPDLTALAAGACGPPLPHATCGVGPTGLCPAPRSAPRANTAERRARVPPRPGSAGPSSGRAVFCHTALPIVTWDEACGKVAEFCTKKPNQDVRTTDNSEKKNSRDHMQGEEKSQLM